MAARTCATTAEIGPFVILNEGSVGAGVRRIEAVTAGEAFALLHERAREADDAARRARARAEAEDGRRRPTSTAPAAAPEVGDQRGGRHQRDRAGGRGIDADALLDLSDRFKQQHAPAAVVLGTSENGRVHLVANFDEASPKKVSAHDVVRSAAALVGGGGGGRPTMARAGGKDPERLTEALAEAEELIVGALR